MLAAVIRYQIVEGPHKVLAWVYWGAVYVEADWAQNIHKSFRETATQDYRECS